MSIPPPHAPIRPAVGVPQPIQIALEHGRLLALTAEGLTLMELDGQVGVRGMKLRLKMEEVVHDVVYATARAQGGALIAEQPIAGTPLRCRVRVRPVEEASAVVVEHELEHDGDTAVRLRFASFGLFGAAASVRMGDTARWDLRYMHTDNMRTEEYPYCQGEFPLVRPLPTRPVWVGRGHDQPFPALYLTDKRYRHGIVMAAASQDLALSVFAIQQADGPGEAGSALARFELAHDWGQAEAVVIEPGQTLRLDGVYLQVHGPCHPQDAYSDYTTYLSQTYLMRGGTTPLLDAAMHCTWNYGVYDDQHHERLITTAELIARELPGIRYFLMDAGYLAKKDGREGPGHDFLDRFYPDPDAAVDRRKMPEGIRAFTNQVRRLGLIPGIWASPTVHLGSDLAREHPDWLLRRADGEPYRIAEHNGFLDATHPEAFAFLDQTFAHILRGWGFEALKLDFWSQNFEDRSARLYDPRHTAATARALFLSMLRKHLGESGVLMTGVATGMGNPFIGRWADTYRNTIDIGSGHWSEQVNNCMWALPTVLIPGRSSFLLNNDSVGIVPDAPEHENLFRLIWTFIHMGMIETGGRIEQLDPLWLGRIRRLTDRCERGFKVRCPDERAFTGEPYPEALFVDYPADSRTRAAGIAQSLALFNWTDRPKVVAVERQALGQRSPVKALDFWSDQPATFADSFIVHTLPPRSAKLYDFHE